jgi:hypothetical protein
MVNIDADSLPVNFLGVDVEVSGCPEPELAAKLTEAGFTVLSIETVDFTPANGPQESQISALCQA